MVLTNPGGDGKVRGEVYEDLVMSLRQEQKKVSVTWSGREELHPAHTVQEQCRQPLGSAI